MILVRPGEYKVACPKSCQKFQQSCMMHYKDRWSCCDDLNSSCVNGCETRWHSYPPSDVDLDAEAAEARRAAEALQRRTMAALEEVESAEDRARLLRTGQRQHMEDTNDEARGIASMFSRLKHP